MTAPPSTETPRHTSSGSEEGVTMAEAIAKLREFDRLGLIIESAVRNADGPNWVTVSDLIKRNRVFMSLVGSGPVAQASPDQRCLEDMTLAHNVRLATIEECARELECSYPRKNPPLNSYCARIRALSAVTPSPGPGEWTPDQFWEYVGAMAGEFEAGQMRDMMAAKGLVLSSTSRCTCQDQHRRGYCTESGCPYAVSSTEGRTP